MKNIGSLKFSALIAMLMVCGVAAAQHNGGGGQNPITALLGTPTPTGTVSISQNSGMQGTAFTQIYALNGTAYNGTVTGGITWNLLASCPTNPTNTSFTYQYRTYDSSTATGQLSSSGGNPTSGSVSASASTSNTSAAIALNQSATLVSNLSRTSSVTLPSISTWTVVTVSLTFTYSGGSYTATAVITSDSFNTQVVYVVPTSGGQWNDGGSAYAGQTITLG